MKKHLLISIITLNLFIVSCTFNSNEIIEINEIDVYETTNENEKIGNDLLTYDYSNMLVNDLKITDNEVLKNITWQYWVSNGSKKVSFRLILNNEAKK